MPVQITIIGLGQVGASMGLALGAYKESIIRVGHDKDLGVEREALKKGAVDKAVHNLPSAAEGARLLVLALPASQTRDTLKYIAQDLPEGAIILDVSPLKAEAAQWARELLPACHYVGIAPAINPELLHDFALGLDSTRADLFTKGACLVSPAQGVPEEALTLAVDFVRLLGALPVLTDVAEADGLVAATHLLPQLISAALLNATIDQPGWQEARKLASRAYAGVTSGIEYHDEVESLKMAALANRVGIVHALDVTIAALRGLRDDLDRENGEGVAERLQAALHGRQRWMGERTMADWDALPKAEAENLSSFFGRLFGSSLFKTSGKK